LESLILPLDSSAIERILPHRFPFLLVDRITELEPDKRIVGIKNVSLNERYLFHQPGATPALPPTILTECVAQVGAILILWKPENRDKLPTGDLSTPATSSRSKRASSGSAAGWVSLKALRASTGESSSTAP